MSHPDFGREKDREIMKERQKCGTEGRGEKRHREIGTRN